MNEAGGDTTLPALLGGNPSVTLNQSAALKWPCITEEDQAAVRRVLDDGVLTRHPVVQEFEEDCRTFFEVPHALTTCNGTTALLAAFYSLDLEPGSEILVPTGTFWASVLPMLWLGLVPVFCESEPDQVGLDVEDAKRKITARTKALVVVHLWGMPSQMDRLLELARQHNLRVIEDVSHAQGARFRGTRCGALGDVAAVSMMGTKLLPAGEGGLFLTQEDTFMERAICLGDIARIRRLESPARRFAATGFGVKTRISSMAAALARVQLKHLDARNQQRNENLLYLSERLEALGFQTYQGPDHVERVYFQFNISWKGEQELLPIELWAAALQAEGCRVCLPIFPLLHEQPIFTEGHFKSILRLPPESSPIEYSAGDCPRTQAFARKFLMMPTFPFADRDLLDQYACAFEKVLKHADSLIEAMQSGKITINPQALYAGVDQIL